MWLAVFLSSLLLIELLVFVKSPMFIHFRRVYNKVKRQESGHSKMALRVGKNGDEQAVEKALGYETNVRPQVGHATNMNLKIIANV